MPSRDRSHHHAPRRPAPTIPALLALTVGLIATACDAAEEAERSGRVFETEAATFRVVQVIDGLRHPWALAFLPDGRLLTTERDGRMLIHDGEQRTEVRG